MLKVVEHQKQGMEKVKIF